MCKCVCESFLCINCISDRDHGIALQGSKEQAHTGSFSHFGLRQRGEKRRQISRVFIFILYLLCQKKKKKCGQWMSNSCQPPFSNLFLPQRVEMVWRRPCGDAAPYGNTSQGEWSFLKLVFPSETMNGA